MPGDRPRMYWDANLFVSYINNDATWADILEVLLEDACVRKEIEIVTSVLSVTEVAFTAAEQARRALRADEEARIDALWSDTRGITLVEYSEVIARKARELRRESMLRGWTGRRTADIVHLATAQHMNVQAAYTTEQALYKYSAVMGFPVQAPCAARMRLPGV